MRRCILVVAMANSVHTQRWLRMVQSEQYSVVLLPCTNSHALPSLAALPRVRSAEDVRSPGHGQLSIWEDVSAPPREMDDALPLPIGWHDSTQFVNPETIRQAISVLKPVLVHSMELQHATYPCLAAARAMGDDFPPWLASNWGSDLYLYEKLDEHRPVLQALMGRITALHSECHRDVQIARRLGYPAQKQVYIMPASGGQDMEKLSMPQSPPSTRDTILIKGYHGWSGRAQFVLSALLMAAPHLRHMRIRLVLANAAVSAMASEVARVTGLDVRAEPWSDDETTGLKRMANARIAVGIGISDGIGTTFLEAMTLGAFPIAATTGCMCEWIRNGIDGLMVNPHDVSTLAEAIILAANDDALVDAASQRNRCLVESRWNVRINQSHAMKMYQDTIAACANAGG